MSRRRRTRSPLCPYTTLFRSLCLAPLLAGGGEGEPRASARFLAGFRESLRRAAVVAAVVVSLFAANALADRKSTRLNSSHSSTSYAVFCLKKQRSLSSYDR